MLSMSRVNGGSNNLSPIKKEENDTQSTQMDLFHTQNQKSIESKPNLEGQMEETIHGITYKGEYKAEVVDGNVTRVPHGKGTLTFPDGTTFVGIFVNGSSTYGEQTSLNGIKYTGEFKHSLPNGKGILTFPDGTTHDGTFVNGSRKGWCCVTELDGTKFEGYFAERRFTGEVTVTKPGGQIVKGTFDINNNFTIQL